MENNNFVITNSITSGDLISSDDNNTLSLGNDGKLYSQPFDPSLSPISRDILYEGALRKNATQQLLADVSKYKLIMVCATIIINNIAYDLWTTVISEQRNIFCIHWFEDKETFARVNVRFIDKTFKVEDCLYGSSFSDLYVSKVVGIK